MTRVLQIFRKDVRHLWPQAAGLLVLMAASAVLDPTFRTGEVSGVYGLLVGFALPGSCWLLIVAAIQEEKLVGDRQYWLTRPYRWRELLAAKALFVAVTVNLPLLIWHASAYVAVGVPLSEHWPALLWRQVFFTAFYVLPAAALAAMTRSLGQVILTALAVVLPAVLLEEFLLARYRLVWQRMEDRASLAVMAIVVVGVAALLLLQYATRNTRRARAVAAVVGLGVVAVPFAGAQLAGGPPVTVRIALRMELAGALHASLAAVPGKPNLVALQIPVRLEGIPAGVDLVPNDLTVSVNGGARLGGELHDVTNGEATMTLYLERAVADSLRTKPVTVRGKARFLAFGNRQVQPLARGQRLTVPRVGVCSDTRDAFGMIAMVCYTPWPHASAMLGTSRLRLNWIIPQGLVERSVPTASGFQPLMRFASQLGYRSWDELRGTQLMAADPLPPVAVDFELAGVELSR